MEQHHIQAVLLDDTPLSFGQNLCYIGNKCHAMAPKKNNLQVASDDKSNNKIWRTNQAPVDYQRHQDYNEEKCCEAAVFSAFWGIYGQCIGSACAKWSRFTCDACEHSLAASNTEHKHFEGVRRFLRTCTSDKTPSMQWRTEHCGGHDVMRLANHTKNAWESRKYKKITILQFSSILCFW